MPPVSPNRPRIKFIKIASVGFMVIALAAIVYSTNTGVRGFLSSAAKKDWRDIGNPRAGRHAGKLAEEASNRQKAQETAAGITRPCMTGCSKEQITTGTKTAGALGYYNETTKDVSGFYIQNGKYYPIAESAGGPSTASLQYVNEGGSAPPPSEPSTSQEGTSSGGGPAGSGTTSTPPQAEGSTGTTTLQTTGTVGTGTTKTTTTSKETAVVTGTAKLPTETQPTTETPATSPTITQSTPIFTVADARAFAERKNELQDATITTVSTSYESAPVIGLGIAGVTVSLPGTKITTQTVTRNAATGAIITNTETHTTTPFSRFVSKPGTFKSEIFITKEDSQTTTGGFLGQLETKTYTTNNSTGDVVDTRISRYLVLKNGQSIQLGAIPGFIAGAAVGTANAIVSVPQKIGILPASKPTTTTTKPAGQSGFGQLINPPSQSTQEVAKPNIPSGDLPQLTPTEVPKTDKSVAFLGQVVSDFVSSDPQTIASVIHQSYPDAAVSVWQPGSAVTLQNRATYTNYILARFKQDPNYASLLDNKQFNNFITDEVGGWYNATQTINGETKTQTTQCVIWQNALDIMNPDLGLANVRNFPVDNASDIFGLANQDQAGVNKATYGNVTLQGAMSDPKYAGQDLKFYVDGDRQEGAVYAYRFSDISKIKPGDTAVYGNHMVPIIAEYKTPDGKLAFIVSEANSPKDGLTGLPHTYVITQDEFASRVNDLSTTVFLRSTSQDQKDQAASIPDAPSSIVDYLNTSEAIAKNPSVGTGATNTISTEGKGVGISGSKGIISTVIDGIKSIFNPSTPTGTAGTTESGPPPPADSQVGSGNSSTGTQKVGVTSQADLGTSGSTGKTLEVTGSVGAGTSQPKSIITRVVDGVKNFFFPSSTPQNEQKAESPSTTTVNKTGNSVTVGGTANITTSESGPTAPEIPSQVQTNNAGSNLENFQVLLQYGHEGGNDPMGLSDNMKINNYGGTLIVAGCGPVTAYNILRLKGYDVTFQQVLDSYTWTEKLSGPDAVLQNLKRNGYPIGSIETNLSHRLIDAYDLNSYDGILIYEGSAGASKKIPHIAAFDCNQGKCYSIDSYFSTGKPMPCEVQSENAVKCNGIKYLVGPTKGRPGAFYPTQP